MAVDGVATHQEQADLVMQVAKDVANARTGANLAFAAAPPIFLGRRFTTQTIAVTTRARGGTHRAA